MKRLVLITLAILAIGTLAFAKSENISTDVNPVSIYGHVGVGTTVIAPLLIGADGSTIIQNGSTLTAMKITVVGDNTYVAIAAIGSAQSAAVWQCKKIAVSGADTVITWADGNSNYDNVATNLTTLIYQ